MACPFVQCAEKRNHPQLPAIKIVCLLSLVFGGMLWPMTERPVTDVRDSLALAAVMVNDPELAPWGTQEEVYWLENLPNIN